MMYAETLLAMGQPEPARAQLEPAYQALDDDMNPFTVADASFDYARALWLTRPAERPKAMQLARAARRSTSNRRRGPSAISRCWRRSSAGSATRPRGAPRGRCNWLNQSRQWLNQ